MATRIWGGLHTYYLPLVANWRRQRWTSKSATSTSDGPIRDLGLGLPHFTCSCLNVCEEHIEPRTERFIEKHDAERERWSVVDVAHVLLTCFSFLYCLWWVRHGRAISSEVSSIRLISFSAPKVLLLVYSMCCSVGGWWGWSEGSRLWIGDWGVGGGEWGGDCWVGLKGGATGCNGA